MYIFLLTFTTLQVVTSLMNTLQNSKSLTKRRHHLCSTVDDQLLTERWDRFVEKHVGRWCGIQSCHYHLDEENSSAADRILCGTQLTLNDNSIDHTNFFVSFPIDFDSDDAVILSDKIVTQNVGTYQKPIIPSKVCGSVAMGGPAMSKNGLSIQFSFRHDDTRMRVMVAYEPSDFVAVPSTSIQIPSSMSMSDITISREKRLDADKASSTIKELPPAKMFTESNPHYLWRKTSMDDFGGQFSGVRDIYLKSGDATDAPKSEIISLAPLPFYEEYEENFQNALLDDDAVGNKGNIDDDDDDQLDFAKIFDGGLLVEAPLVILAGELSNVKISWSVPNQGGAPNSQTVYIADASFTSMNDAVNKTRRKRRGDNFVDQPVLTDFSVQTLTRE
jgi:hypothetical protein